MFAVIFIVVAAAWIAGFYRVLTLFLDEYNAHHPELEEFRMAYEMCDNFRRAIIVVLVLLILFVSAPLGIRYMLTGKHP